MVDMSLRPSPFDPDHAPSTPPARPWAMLKGLAGMAGIILMLLTLALGYVHLRAATPAREGAMGLLRERPEVAAALGMPFTRSVAVNLYDILPYLRVEGAYRYVILVHGPEGWGLAEITLFPLAKQRTAVRFRPGLFGEWEQFPRAVIPERPIARSSATMEHALDLLQKGEPQRARELLSEVLRMQPLLPAAWYLRAVASRDLGDNEAALEDALWALELEHPDPELVVLIEQVLPADAGSRRVVAWNRFLAYAPHNPIARARHARARAESGDVEPAAKFLSDNCALGSEEACKTLQELVRSGVIVPPPLEPVPNAAAR